MPECASQVDHCWHEVRKEKREFHTKDEHGPYNPEPDHKYTVKGVIDKCCKCGKEEWHRTYNYSFGD